MTLQTKLELSEDSNNGVPDVKALVQELLTDIFISTYNHQVIAHFKIVKLIIFQFN